MTYLAETKPNASKTRRLLETADMKMLRKIAEKTLMDTLWNETREICKVDISMNRCIKENKNRTNILNG